MPSEEGLFSCLTPPVTREVVYCISEAARKPEIAERQRKIWYSSSPQSKDWEAIDFLTKDTGNTNRRKVCKDEKFKESIQKKMQN